MTIAYLDPDDEITSAVARLRSSEDVRVALVLPPGSRIATSRINFRLLAHEAREHQRRLAVVAGEPGVRAVAVSAGLPAYASVAEYEAALATGGTEPAAAEGSAVEATTPQAASRARRAKKGAAGAGAGASAAATGAVAIDALATGPAPAAVPAPASRGPDLPVVAVRGWAGRGGRRSLWVAISGLLVVALVVVAGFVALDILPTATITIQPRVQAVGPVTLTVTADPDAATVDVAGARVPAQAVSIPLTATDTFAASGTKDVDTAATGTVTFTSRNTGRTVTIPAGTQVSTAGSEVFTTNKAVTVPRAVFLPPTAGVATVGVTALVTGPEGNVPAGAITHVSSSIQAALVNGSDPVDNEAATTGGLHKVVQVVKQADYDAAVAGLTAELTSQLQAAANDPANVPAGVTLIPATATVGATTADQAASGVVGRAEDDGQFTLTLTGSGTILGVDQAEVAQVAAARLASTVPAGYQLFPSTVQPQVGPAVVSGGTITFSAAASGQMVAQLDAAALVEQVRGKSVDDARGILGALGTVTIETWPFYSHGVPDDPGRVTLTVTPPQPAVTGSPTPGSSAP